MESIMQSEVCNFLKHLASSSTLLEEDVDDELLIGCAKVPLETKVASGSGFTAQPKLLPWHLTPLG